MNGRSSSYPASPPSIAVALTLLLSGHPSQPASAQETIDLGALAAEDAEGGAATSAEEPESAFDVVDDLEAGTGVRVQTICTNCNAASLSVNGLTGQHVRVTWDGIPVEGGLGTVYYLTQVPSELVGYTKVKRGPGSVLSGSAGIAGSIDFHSARPKERRTIADLQLGDWGWRQLRAGYADRWGPVSGVLFVQGALEDEYDSNDDGANEVADFERTSYHGILSLDLTRDQTLTLQGLFYGENQVDGPGAYVFDQEKYVNEDAYFHWRRFSIDWNLERASGTRLNVKARYSRRGQQQWAPNAPGQPKEWTYIIEDEQSMAAIRSEVPLGAASYLTTQLGWSKQRLAVQTPDIRIQPFFIVDRVEELEALVQWDRSLGARWDLSLGGRYDVITVDGWSMQDLPGPVPRIIAEVDDIERTFFSPRLQASYRASSKHVLSMAVGRGITPPRPVFESTCCGAKYQRNINLRPERAWSAQASLEFKPTPDQRITGTIFWSDIADYHERAVYETAGYIPHYTNDNLDWARIQGIDVIHDMRFKGNRFNVGWTYTFTDADGKQTKRDTFSGDVLWTLDGVRYVPEHEASAYFRYDDAARGRSFSLDATYKGSVQHYRLSANLEDPRLLPLLESEDFVTVSARYDHRLGRGPWTLYGGVANIGDYTMPDLGEPESAYDWGPIQGRFVYGGVKFDP